VPARDPAADHVLVRNQLSAVRSLLVLSMLMVRYGDEEQILELAVGAMPSLGRLRAEGVHLDGMWRPAGPSSRSLRLGPQLDALGPAGGRLDVAQGWAFAASLAIPGGFLVVSADSEPSEHERFLLQVLSQQTGVALTNARLLARERAQAERLRAANLALTQSMAIHERFTRVALTGGGQEGIAQALHDLTGYAVAVEDRYGNLVAWAGPGRPDPYPRDGPREREELVDGALRAGGPLRAGGRLVLAVAQPGQDTLGILALVDPDETAGAPDRTALEHGGTVLAMELARLQNLDETRLRLQRDLVETLLSGTGERDALHTAQALRYDLGRPHRVVVAEGTTRGSDNDVFFQAVLRAAHESGAGSLVVARAGAVVVLADADRPWEDLRATVLARLPGGRCRVGVGSVCRAPREYRRSYREARLALRLQATAAGPDRALTFDELGVYQVLGQAEDPAAVERLVRRWLGPLIDHDSVRGSQLVATLDTYLQRGGNYVATATALSVHRSTLKYRLQRIRDITGADLNDPDTRFNLQLACRAWRTLRALRDL
jgi:DNA-binding PucR family transcriptional regulator